MRYLKRMAVGCAAMLVSAGAAQAGDAAEQAASAARGEVKVADDVPDDGAPFSGIDYGISERLQRAWLVLHFAEDPRMSSDGDGECCVDRSIRVRLPGLTYDPATRQVLFHEEGTAPVVCARVVRHRFLFSWESIDATGKCGSRMAKVTSFVDDGYEGRVVHREQVFFGVRR